MLRLPMPLYYLLSFPSATRLYPSDHRQSVSTLMSIQALFVGKDESSMIFHGDVYARYESSRSTEVVT